MVSEKPGIMRKSHLLHHEMCNAAASRSRGMLVDRQAKEVTPLRYLFVA